MIKVGKEIYAYLLIHKSIKGTYHHSNTCAFRFKKACWFIYWQMLRSSDVPLKDRVLKSSNLSVPLVSLSRRPDTYKHWTDVQIDKALDAVRKKSFTVRRAAEEFGVPKSTLHDRISGRVQVGGHSGPSKYLSDEEEDELEEFLVGAAAVEYARSRQQVIQLVQDVSPSEGFSCSCVPWLVGFI